jgi:hypothetical protein
MIRQRALAVLLLLVAFAALAASKAFPFLDDVPGWVRTAVAVAGGVSGLAGVALWLRKPPGEQSAPEAGEQGAPEAYEQGAPGAGERDEL